jgi:hypothetical protein
MDAIISEQILVKGDESVVPRLVTGNKNANHTIYNIKGKITGF